MVRMILTALLVGTLSGTVQGQDCNFGFEQLSCRYQGLRLFAYEVDVDRFHMEVYLNGKEVVNNSIACQRQGSDRWSFEFDGFNTEIESSITLTEFKGYGFNRLSTDFPAELTFEFCDVD